ncbi:PREDICTED: allatostatins [Dufourea novaeangliae]|uniref:allatostatins n=1 Tax=Dufourea novaeangliae TaxID=178035 RepID=UPI000767C717|nr:PREDICTED: allatostatins [Dufourea novaeangliae]
MFNMRTRYGLLTSSVAFVCVVGVVGRSAAAMEETPASSLNLQHYNSLDSIGFDDTLPEKRAYTYVSEYKRLPVYNFGIGKRWVDNNDDKRGRQYSFGLGKRTKQYSFGLGKRNDNVDYPLRMNLDYVPIGGLGFHSQELQDDQLEEKRGMQPYSFGLGLGKRMSGDEEDTLE